MSFLFYFAVLLFAAASAVFGLDLMTSPLPQHPKAAVADAAAPSKQGDAPQGKKQVAARDDNKAESDHALSPAHSAKPGAAVARQNASVQNASQQQASAATQSQQSGAVQSEANAARAEATGSTPAGEAGAANIPAQPVAQQTANRCNVQACSSAYRSFRESDCTYQPFEGPRRVCVRPPSSHAASQPRQEQAQDRRQARKDTYRDTGPRVGERRLRATRNWNDDDYYDDDASIFAGRGRRVIVVPDDRYNGYYR